MITKSQVSRLASLSLMTAILVVAGIFSAMTAMRIAIRGKEVAVPDLTGKTEAEARQILNRSGLVLGKAQSRFVPGVSEGRIVEQNPKKNIRLKTGRSVKVLVSLGEQTYPVPSLLGKSARAAQLTLAERKLKVGITDFVHTNEGELSTVVYQSPAPETVNGTDPTVNIMVSLGPLEQYYTMPDLVGQPIDSVTARARVEGFKIGKPSYRKYSGITPGVVTQQKPQAGYRISKNDTILLEVNQ
jgi:beta-lactam-binding protein with PASTA domain